MDATLYVNPKTYLPVLVIWNNRTHYRDGRPLDGTTRQEITALPATAGNIAKANVTVPAGFRKVPSSTFGGPGDGPTSPPADCRQDTNTGRAPVPGPRRCQMRISRTAHPPGPPLRPEVS